MRVTVAVAIILFSALAYGQEDPINSVTLSGTYYRVAGEGADYTLLTLESPAKGSVLTPAYFDVLIVKAKHRQAVEDLAIGDNVTVTGYLFSFPFKGRLLTVVKVEALSIR